MASWPQVALGDVAELRAGTGFPLGFQGRSDEAYPFAKVSDISAVARSGAIEISEAAHSVSEQDLQTLRVTPFPPGTVAFAKIGEAIRQNYRVVTTRPMLFDNNVMGLIPDAKQIDGRFLLRFLQTQDFYARTGRTAVPAIRSSILRAVRVPLPPLPEQQRIAAILDKADAVGRKRQQTLDLADELLRSAFLDMFGDPVTNPKGWPERRFDSFAEIRGGVMKGRKLDGHHVVTVPYVRVANVQDGFLDLREVKQIEVLDTDVDKYRLLRGDVLLTEGGDPDKLGRGAVWTGEIEPCIHQNHIFGVRVDAHVAEPQYISTLLGSAYGKRYFLRAGKQTTGIATINRTQLCGFPAFLPPVRLQHAYASLVGHFGQSQRHRMLSLNEHDALAGALVRRAFRGEI